MDEFNCQSVKVFLDRADKIMKPAAHEALVDIEMRCKLRAAIVRVFDFFGDDKLFKPVAATFFSHACVDGGKDGTILRHPIAKCPSPWFGHNISVWVEPWRKFKDSVEGIHHLKNHFPMKHVIMGKLHIDRVIGYLVENPMIPIVELRDGSKKILRCRLHQEILPVAEERKPLPILPHGRDRCLGENDPHVIQGNLHPVLAESMKIPPRVNNGLDIKKLLLYVLDGLGSIGFTNKRSGIFLVQFESVFWHIVSSFPF